MVHLSSNSIPSEFSAESNWLLASGNSQRVKTAILRRWHLKHCLCPAVSAQGMLLFYFLISGGKIFRWIKYKLTVKDISGRAFFFLVFLISQSKNNWNLLKTIGTLIPILWSKLGKGNKTKGEKCCIFISQMTGKGRGSIQHVQFVLDFWIALLWSLSSASALGLAKLGWWGLTEQGY